MAKHNSLTKAQKNKKDEFYTLYSDIEQELSFYTEYLKNKIILMNCDNPQKSNFWKYFYNNFNKLHLKKIIATYYNQDQKSIITTFDGKNIVKYQMKENGDFRNQENIKLLEKVDLIVTNPPFSLFKEFIAQLIQYKKKFIIWGNNNAIAYKQIFPLFAEKKIWLGNIANKTCYFQIPNSYPTWHKTFTEKQNDGKHYARVTAISVFTNVPLQNKKADILLQQHFIQAKYLLFDDYPAFNVDKVVNLPIEEKVDLTIKKADFCEFQQVYKNNVHIIEQKNDIFKIQIFHPIFAVPISFLAKYNNNNLAHNFDIIGEANHGSDNKYDLCKPVIHNKLKFKRLLIRHK